MSTDNYMEVLKPYIDQSIVEIYHFPVFPFRNDHQQVLYNHALDMARNKNEWLAIIDTDEFITPVTTKNLKDYLRANKNYGGICISWLLFGTSSVKEIKPNELLIEKLNMRAPQNDSRNIWIKSIVQPNLTVACVGPHDCSYLPSVHVYSPPVDELRINHYFVRDENFLYNVKLERLRQWNSNMFNPRDILDYMPIANSVLDISMLRFVRPLKKRINEPATVSK